MRQKIAKQSGHHVTVMTLNLRFGLADDGPNSWRFRKKAFSALFRQYSPDFLNLQEANDFQIDFIAPVLADYGYIGKRDHAPSFWQHNIIFYRHKWHKTFYEHFFLSPTPKIPSRFRDSRWPRQCTIGIFEFNELKLITVNTHFDFDSSVQERSAGIILEKLRSLPDLPVILCGDFNATPADACFYIFTGKQTSESHGGQRHFKSIFSDPFPGTYHKFTGKTDGPHIDWILYSGNLSATKRCVVQDRFNGFFPSDHYPVYAEFHIKP